MELLANASVARLVPVGIIKFIVSAGINSALLAWARRAELSCDRAALLVTQDPHVIGRSMMKLAGGTFASKIDYEEFSNRAGSSRKPTTLKRSTVFGRIYYCRHVAPVPDLACSRGAGVGRERAVPGPDEQNRRPLRPYA